MDKDFLLEEDMKFGTETECPRDKRFPKRLRSLPSIDTILAEMYVSKYQIIFKDLYR